MSIGALAVFLSASFRRYDIILLKKLINFFHGHIIQVPVVADIISVTGVVSIGRV